MVIATASDEGHPLERYRRTWELHGSWSYPFISQKLETHQNLEVFEEKTNQQNATTRRRPVPWSEYPHQFCCSSSINMKQKKHWYYPIPCLYYPPKPWFFVGHFAHILGHLGTVCWRTGNGIWLRTSWSIPVIVSPVKSNVLDEVGRRDIWKYGTYCSDFFRSLKPFLCSHTWTLLEFLGRMDDLLRAAGPSHWITGPDFSSRTCNFRRKLNGQISLVTIRNLGGS